MNKILVGFSKPKSWQPFSALIMFGYGIPYDHVYIRIESGKYERTLIYQASKSLVNFTNPQIFDISNVVVKEFEFDVSPEVMKKVMQFAIDNVGKPYGIKLAFGLAWVRINELLGRTIKNPFSDGGATYVCSGLGCAVLEDLNIKLPKEVDDMTPKDVYDLMESIKS